MAELLPTIRNAVRAIILRDDHILLLRKEYEDGSELYALPGGGQDTGETLEISLRRECREEIGCDIELHQLLHVADYFKHRQTTPPSRRHLVELLFLCSVPADYSPHNGSHPDKHQVEVVWLPQTRLSTIAMMPPSLVTVLSAVCESHQRVGIESHQRAAIKSHQPVAIKSHQPATIESQPVNIEGDASPQPVYIGLLNLL
jgi:ADP-ribose pyrophosphatase YjhB (NUDIX family)